MSLSLYMILLQFQCHMQHTVTHEAGVSVSVCANHEPSTAGYIHISGRAWDPGLAVLSVDLRVRCVASV